MMKISFRKNKYLKILLVIFISVYFIMCLRLYLNQEAFIFFPSNTVRELPEELGLEEVNFKTSDQEVLNALWLNNNPEAKTVLFFHGNAGNAYDRFLQMRYFKELGLNALIFDYRGYGKSSGKISEENDLYIDAETAYKYLTEERKIDSEDIVIWGRSLGAAIAIDLAAKVENADRLIIESTFTSYENLAKEEFWFMPIGLLARYELESKERIKDIRLPILIIHGNKDRIIPMHHGKKLFDAIKENKSFIELNGGHNDGYIISEKEYLNGIKEFLTLRR